MDWQEFFKTLTYFGFSAIAISGMVAYLIKKLTEQQLKKDFEEFRVKLQVESENDKTRYTILQEKRAKKIEVLYQKILEIEESVQGYLHNVNLEGSIDKSKFNVDYFTNIREETEKQLIDFQRFYLRNKIFFEKKTCESIDKFIRVLSVSILGIMYEIEEEDLFPQNSNDAFNKLNQEIPSIKETILEDFRKIIGVSS